MNATYDAVNRDSATSLVRILGGKPNGGGGLTIAADAGGMAVFVFFVAGSVYVAARSEGALIVAYEKTESVNLSLRPELFTKRFEKKLIAAIGEARL